MTREKLFSVKISDCTVQHFRAGGKGGQKQNKTNSGTRIIHDPSGAVGECREYASQWQNKKTAFRRMAESSKFQHWARAEALQIPTIDEIVDEAMREENLLVEYFNKEIKK